MQYGEAMAALRKNDLKRLYLVAGEEKYLAEKFIKALTGKLLPANDQAAINKLDDTASINDIIEACSTVPFFSEKNIIYVHNGSLFKEKKSKSAQKQEEQFLQLLSGIPDFTTLILEIDEKPDKRRKLYKTIDKYGTVVEADPLRAYNISEWLRAKFKSINKQPDAEAYEYLLSTINVMQKISLGFLDKELDKLSLYTDRHNIKKDDLVNVLSGLPEISIFALAEAVGSKDIKKSLFLLAEQQKAGVHPISILAILTRHIRQLWKIKTYLAKGMQSRDIAKTMGLVPFITEKLIKQARHFDLKVLHQAIIDFAEADYRLKTGQASPALFEDILIKLCR